MGFKQVPRPRGRIAAAAAIAALGCLLPASDVFASVPATFTPSKLQCSDTDGPTFRPGDDITCALTIALTQTGELFPERATGVTATVDIPPNTTWVSGGTPGPSSVTWSLGDFSADPTSNKTVIVHFLLGDNATTETPGYAVSTVAHLTGMSMPSGTSMSDDVSSNTLYVDPPVANLSGSSLACQDITPPPPAVSPPASGPFPGDVLSCTLTIADAPSTENATNVRANVPIPLHTTFVAGSGGTSATASAIFFGNDLLAQLPGTSGLVPSGQSGQPASFQLQLASDTPGNTAIGPVATVLYTNALSLTAAGITVTAPPLITLPGPAILSASRVFCKDTNGGALVPGDNLACTLTIADLAGREDADGLSATIGIPPGTQWVDGGTSHTATTITFDPSSLGKVLAGSSISQSYHLSIDPAATVGTVLAAVGSVSGISEPLTKQPVQSRIRSNALTIGENPAVGPAGPSADLSVTAAMDKPAAQVVRLPSKGTVAAHIEVTLSNGGPSIAQQPSFTVSLPSGAQFESFDASNTVSCSRATPSLAVCTLAANALGAQSSASAGIGLGLSTTAKDTGVRLIALGATSATPDPTSNDASLAIRVQAGAPSLTAHSFTIRVRPGKSLKASVLKHVTGRPSHGKFRVTVPKPTKPKKHSKKKPRPVKGAPRKGKVSIQATTITYKAPRNAKGSDSFRYTFYDGLGHRSSATVTVKFVKP